MAEMENKYQYERVTSGTYVFSAQIDGRKQTVYVRKSDMPDGPPDEIVQTLSWDK